MFKKIILLVFTTVFVGCGIYTFSGSTLPSYIKTVSIPVFVNKTMEPGIAEEMTRKVKQSYIRNNTLKIREKNAQSSLIVILNSYTNKPFTYDQNGNVREYKVIISANATFKDEVKNKIIWEKNNIVCYGIYSINGQTRETERNGKEKAFTNLSNILIENTIAGW